MDEWLEYSAKTVDEALTEALIDLKTTSENIEYEVIEKESSGFLGLFNNKSAKIRVKKKYSVDGCITSFLQKVLVAMKIEAKVEANYNEEENTVYVQLIGNDMGVLIGKRGQTLDSLQYLASLVVNKSSEGYLKVKLDTENYRERRKETLENLAANIAIKVKRTRKAVSLEPMNPYERRIIHSALQNDKFVDTHSEGDEPLRKVVVTPKKSLRDNREGRFNNNRNRDNNGRNGYNKKYGSSYNKGYNKTTDKKEFERRYGADTVDYSKDYKKDYAAYLEQKAAAKAAAEQAKAENDINS